MKYPIKTYNEEFLPDQVNIGKEVTSSWKFYSQSSEEKLKEVYSRMDFDPKTKFYAFVDDQMVGFQTSKILDTIDMGDDFERKADLEIPIVVKGHKDVQDVLMDHSLKILKSRGVNVVRTKAGSIWGDSLKIIEKYNYSLEEELLSRTKIDPALIDTSVLIPDSSVTDFNFEKDAQDLAIIFSNLYRRSVETLM